MKEGALELLDTQLAEIMGWIKFKGSGVDGAADSIYVKKGRCFMVERKKPRKKQQPNQVRFQALITANGTDYYVVDDTDQEIMRTILIKQEAYFEKDSKR